MGYREAWAIDAEAHTRAASSGMPFVARGLGAWLGKFLAWALAKKLVACVDVFELGELDKDRKEMCVRRGSWRRCSVSTASGATFVLHERV